ncbi:MAG: 16S rRNA (guanine(527)-N(7))-methyltransferase RsmG [Solirubrobacteraceae bacterium]
MNEAVTKRLTAICNAAGLQGVQRAQLERLLAVLAADDHAPTTVRDPALAVDVHLADSLSALGLEAVRRSRRIADIGSGAGFPALPLAIALPTARVVAVEAAARKAAYIEQARDAAEIGNAVVVRARAEDWAEGVSQHDLVCARAVAPLGVICEYAAPLLVPGGAVVVWKGAKESEEEEVAGRAANELGLEHAETVRTRPYPGSRHHHLYVYLKVGVTPSRFPRKAGMARKRQLGASS